MRRKVAAAPKAAGLDEKKLAQCVKKLDAQSIPSVEQLLMINEDDTTALYFNAPKGSSSFTARVFLRRCPLLCLLFSVSANMRNHSLLRGRPSPTSPPMRFPSSCAVQGNFDSNTYIVSGPSNKRMISDLISGQNAAQMKAAYEAATRAGTAGTQATVDEEDDEMPELEQDFEAASIKK